MTTATPPSLPLAEAARTLTAAHTQGVLSTLQIDSGYPYGSVVDYLPLPDGDAVLLLSTLAEHQHYLAADARAALLIAPGLNRPGSLAEARLTLIGSARAVPNRGEFRDAYLARHPQSARYIDFADFGFYRLRVEQARYIAGFGRMGWLDQAGYRNAEPDILAAVAAGAIQHMNQDHRDSMRDYARAFARLSDVTDCAMTGLDRFGFELLCRRKDGSETVRIAFDPPLTQAGQLRPALVELAERARAALAATD